jgi:hypothetical protein
MVSIDSNEFPPFDKGGIKGGFFGVGQHRGPPYSNRRGSILLLTFDLAQFFGAQLLAQHLPHHGLG